MRSEHSSAGHLSIMVASLSLALAVLLNSGVMTGGAKACGAYGFDCFERAVIVAAVGAIAGLVIALVGFSRNGVKSWANWIGLTISMLPLLAIGGLVVLLALR